VKDINLYYKDEIIYDYQQQLGP